MQIINYINNNKIVKYVFSGGTAFCVHLATLYILTDIFHLWYLFSTIIAFCLAVTVSYSLQKFWTFKNYSIKNMHLQFSGFFLFALFTLSLNTFLMYLFVDKFGVWYILAQVIINIFTAFLNYIFYSRIIFDENKK
jgi:putative flippase GtrA